MKNRRTTTLLTILSVAISVILLLGVERVRTQAKQSFANTISGTDLIVGARSGQVNLLLYSIFRIGNPTNNISWQSYQSLIKNPKVKWTVPLSLGDSHRGFRVLGTNPDYFEFYKYAKKQPLRFSQGQKFSGLFDTVIGADVAKTLNYKIGSKVIIAHGISDKSFNRHDKLPFKVTGILEPTGTPVDKTVHVTLQGIEAIHIGWESGAKLGKTPAQSLLEQRSFEPKQITAFLMGMHSKVQTFSLQRQINTYLKEPLSAIMPGIALHELWGIMSIAEQALLAVSIFVVVAGLLGMLSSLLTSLQARRREMAILRAVGAKPSHVFSLLVSEATLISALGILLGTSFLFAALWVFTPYIRSQFGINIELTALSIHEWYLLAAVQIAGVCIGCIPALSAYRMSLSDGMSIRV